MEDNQSENGAFKYTPTDSQVDTKDAATSYIEVPEKSTTDTSKTSKSLISWKAPNAFSYNKSPVWYVSVLAVTLAIAAGIYFATKDKITTGVIIFCGLVFGVYGAKKPRVLDYQLTLSGFSVNGRHYTFGSYKSFSIVAQGEQLSAVLTPLKRFMPYMYIYFGRDIEKQITSTLTNILPQETRQGDVIDRALRKIGF